MRPPVRPTLWGIALFVPVLLIVSLTRPVSAEPGEPFAAPIPVPGAKTDMILSTGVGTTQSSTLLSRRRGSVLESPQRWPVFRFKERKHRRERAARGNRSWLNSLLDRKSWSILLYRGGALHFGNAIPRLKFVRYRQGRTTTDPGILAPVIFVNLAGGVF